MTQVATGLPALLSLDEVAAATGLSTKTIRRYAASGILVAHRVGPRMIRIERDSVMRLLHPISA